jgi:DNA polymerase II small subunit
MFVFIKMEEELLKFCIEKGVLVDKETLGQLKGLDNVELAKEIVENIKKTLNSRFITKTLLVKNIQLVQRMFMQIDEEKKRIVENLLINLGVQIEITKESKLLPIALSEASVEEKIKQLKEEREKNFFDVKIISSPILKTRKLEVQHFIKHFRNRFLKLQSILKNRPDTQNLTSIDKLNGLKQGVCIIGSVFSKRITKNNNLLLEVEDLTGKAIMLANKNRPEVYVKAQELLLDDVVAFKCSGTGEMMFVNDIIYPDAALAEKKKLGEEEYALFTSDAHVGSSNFLESNFLKLIDFINGKIPAKEDYKKIKYLFLVGDNVDGVGVYPGQEALLDIKDINKQYDKLAELLSMIRSDVRIIMCPGQHDSVRVAEPQPPIGRDYGAALFQLPNLFLVGNPALVSIGNSIDKDGFKVLMYHGASFHSIINEIDELRMSKAHDSPTKVTSRLLKRRHLAPTHSSVIYIPGEINDPLVIDEVPDIFATGELHRSDIGVYNNILMISSSCWQSVTPYEEKVGDHPDPCKVPMLNLKTREIKILDFS